MTGPALILALAAVAHEANRQYCLTIGDASQPAWDDAPEWQRRSAVLGVEFVLGGGDAPGRHAAWAEQKRAEGWTYGPVKDTEFLTHPCLVPFEELPEEQRTKDHLFGAVVRAAHRVITGRGQ